MIVIRQLSMKELKKRIKEFEKEHPEWVENEKKRLQDL